MLGCFLNRGLDFAVVHVGQGGVADQHLFRQKRGDDLQILNRPLDPGDSNHARTVFLEVGPQRVQENPGRDVP